MNPAELVGRFATARVLVIGVLPTGAAALYIAFLVGAGAPGPLDLSKAWQATTYSHIAQAIPAVLGVILLAIVIHPLQSLMIGILSIRIRAWGNWKELWRVARGNPFQLQKFEPSRLGDAIYSYNPDAWYGLSKDRAWPRLYPLLSDTMRAAVDDRRDQVDFAVRVCFMAFVTFVASLMLLSMSGKGMLLALVPAVLWYLSYLAAILTAGSYNEVCRVAVDLHRFDLLNALHIKLPENPSDERTINVGMSEFWKTFDRSALPARYKHPA